MIREEFGPKLEELKAEVQSKGWLAPRVVYGYFPCHAEGQELVILDPEHRREELGRGSALPAPARRAEPLPLRLLPPPSAAPTWWPSRW